MIYDFANEQEADRFMECVRTRDEEACMAETKPLGIRPDTAQHPQNPSDDLVRPSEPNIDLDV